VKGSAARKEPAMDATWNLCSGFPEHDIQREIEREDKRTGTYRIRSFGSWHAGGGHWARKLSVLVRPFSGPG
jgi:hypothetical protein